MLTARASRVREWAVFTAVALVPAVATGALALRALRNEEAAIRREVALAASAEAAKVGARIETELAAALEAVPASLESDRDPMARVRALAPPFAAPLVLEGGRPLGSRVEAPAPVDPACRKVGARLAMARDRERDELLTSVLGPCREARSPAGRWLILFVGTYKIGETLVDSLYSSFLIDSGYTPAQIGGWLGIWGMVASTLGSLTGGFFASRLPILTAVALTSLLRVAAMGGECYLTFLSPPLPADILGVSLAEHFAGGALTTAMFAFMMMRVDKRIGASHYTVLASIEVLGKMPTGLFAGVMATHIGYRATFLLGTALSAVFLLLLIPLRKLPAVSPLDADSAS